MEETLLVDVVVVATVGLALTVFAGAFVALKRRQDSDSVNVQRRSLGALMTSVGIALVLLASLVIVYRYAFARPGLWLVAIVLAVLAASRLMGLWYELIYKVEVGDDALRISRTAFKESVVREKDIATARIVTRRGEPVYEVTLGSGEKVYLAKRGYDLGEFEAVIASMMK
ncbi:hypothetical protein INS90_01275 [Trueperella pecoris]|uniref:Uncharacterized protein n=1 Tax=Trueperella pecoris TaxID=2733571 RepID=A0A7M1R392_9ACTO|nr:hypothetical protein [Trueperella pecoris]QOR47967.1 hypothetical protein INS90_01275 [Trueperella pecoris]